MVKGINVKSGYSGVTVLHDLKFDVGHEIFAILGANGAGKSTLMKTIAKVLPLSGGEIFFKEEKSVTTSDSNPNIVNMSAKSDAEWLKLTKRLSHGIETFIKTAPKIVYHFDKIVEYLEYHI